MSESILLAVIWSPAASVVVIAIVLEVRRRRNPSVEQQMRKAFEVTSARCAKGMHEWNTPWTKGAETRVYASEVSASATADRLPVRRETSYTTTCRHCGEPHAKSISR